MAPTWRPSVLALATIPFVNALDYPECQPPNTFTQLTFANARLARSNLGGLGGRCDAKPELCTHGSTTSMPHEIYIEGIASIKEDGGEGHSERNVQVDLRITNMSEYRGWNVNVRCAQHCCEPAS